MEDPIPYDPPPSSNPNPNEVGFLPIPPLDHDMLAAGDLLFPENFSGEVDGDFSFPADFDFTFDDISFADDLLLSDPPSSDLSQDRNPNSDEDRSPPIARVYDCSSPAANQGAISSEESNFGEKMSCSSPEYGSCKSNSGVSRDSGNHSDRDVSSSSFTDNNHALSASEGLGDRKIKVEGIKYVSKRKQEEGNSNGEGRTSKVRRSSSVTIATTAESEQNMSVGGGSEEDDKRKARLMRNRESAQLSRQRKKQYVEELEDKVRSMHSTITELNSKISYMMSENATLRQQLSSGGGGGAGVCAPPGPPPHGMMYPMAPMPYPWMPCPPAYMVKPQGSQVPLVPIPRLKPQQPTPAPKVNKKLESKKNESKKSEGKTKKVASISFLGLLFFALLFGGLVPMVNVRYGGSGDKFTDLQKGKVFVVDKHVGRTGYGADGKFSHGRILQQTNSSDGSVPGGNSSEPLTASLYVPRNDKLVKIDGNLIIHSILASEKAMASNLAEGPKTSEETSLAIAGPYPVPGPGRSDGRHSHFDRNPKGRQRALGSGSDDLKSTGSDGKLQQWFREGLAGPMLSSGMCTEVFQFDVSPAPGAIVPATSVGPNTTSEHHRSNSTRLNKPRNRRILHGHPIPLDGRVLNSTEEHVQPQEQSDGLKSNSSRSSMVVSVLVDPREIGDGDGEGVIGSKTLSRIFVVVLIDSVKYVTYSCMLPFMGSGNHLVTT